MKTFLCAFLAALVCVAGIAAGFGAGREDEDPTPAVQEIVTSFERDADRIQLKGEEEMSSLRLETIEQLHVIQDRLCRDAKLDEAVAVRDRIRNVCGKPLPNLVLPLPPDAEEILNTFDLRAKALERKVEENVLEAGQRAAEPLQRILDGLCRDAKLDEAVAVREVIRQITGVISDVRKDPGNLHAQATEIGKVLYFDVVGAPSGSIYGTDIYTSDSWLAAAAVHTGALKVGEKGIVKVTVLPGQPNYEATVRHGITSYAYGQWGVSFKVERVYGIVRTTAKMP